MLRRFWVRRREKRAWALGFLLVLGFWLLVRDRVGLGFWGFCLDHSSCMFLKIIMSCIAMANPFLNSLLTNTQNLQEMVQSVAL
jgi:hypothetical protein